MSKYTPGPWAIGGIYPNWKEDRRAITADDGSKYHRRMTIARIVTPTCYAETHPEIEANANLIAAAPELYEALCDLIDEQNGPPLLGRREVQWLRAIKKARKAIAKAEGRE